MSANSQGVLHHLYINSVQGNIKFTRENSKKKFLDCALQLEENGSFNIGKKRKPTHSERYLLFTFQTQKEMKRNTHKVGRNKLWLPNWAFIKSIKRPAKHTGPPHEGKNNKPSNIVVPFVAGVSEKLWRIFSKQVVPVHFKVSHTLRQRLFHLKDKIPKHKLSNVGAVQCSEEGSDLCIGKTKQLLYRRVAKHRRAWLIRTRFSFISKGQGTLTRRQYQFERSEGYHQHQSRKTLIKQMWWSETLIISQLESGSDTLC